MLNYAVIIQYLTQQLNIPNVRIAEWLNLDPSIISNIKNNKRKMQKDISYDVFYRDVFCQAEIGTDFQSVHSLYTYLQDKDCSNEVIAWHTHTIKNTDQLKTLKLFCSLY